MGKTPAKLVDEIFLQAHLNFLHTSLANQLLYSKLVPNFNVCFQEGASKKDRDDFLSEAALVAQFNDPNVISIEGVVLRGMQGHFM